MPKHVTIYHNPRCTKSRQTLALLKERGVEPEIIEYLSDPPDVQTLRDLVAKLGIAAKDLARRKEFNELGVAAPAGDDGWLQLMAEHPRIIERPIVVAGRKAALGRPPENVLAIV